MQCNHPTIIRAVLKDGTVKQMAVPCGKCAACRIAKKREWTIRLLHEGICWNEKCFVTLTYRPSDLPDDEGLHKRDLQLFFKRLRKRLNGRFLRYFACGEYGDRFNRPHYHAIIYGVSVKDRDEIELAWPYGFVEVENVSLYRYQYVTGYVQKKLSGDYAKKEYGDRQPPFQLQSKGLGLEFFEDNKDEILSDLSCETWTGDKFALPRYYRKKAGDELSTEVLYRLSLDKRKGVLSRLNVEPDCLDTPEHVDEQYMYQLGNYYSPLNVSLRQRELSQKQRLKTSLDRRKK